MRHLTPRCWGCFGDEPTYLEALVVTLVRMSGMPVRQVGVLLGVTDQRLWHPPKEAS